MKKIILFIFLVLFASAFFVNHLRADVTLPDVPVTLNAIFDDENGLINSPIGAQVYGSTITVHQSIGQPGSDFAFWVVNGVIRQDLPIDHSFVVTSTLNLLAVFHPTDPLEYAVVFMDANGALIGDPQYVTPGDNAVEPVELPNKPGLAIAQTKWRTPLGAEAILTNIQSNSVFILQYESASVDTFTITVENAAGSGTYNYNQLVSLTADLTSGSDDFSHWAEGDVVLSYDPNYVFTVVGDRTITAVYKAITDDIVPVVTMTKDLEVRGGYHTYLGQYYLPPTFTVVEYGFLIHEDNTLDLTLTTPGVQIAMNNKAHPLTNEFVMSFPYGSLFNVQGYLVVSNGVDLITVYTNQNSRYIADPLYAEDFESVTTWGSYPTTDALRTFGGIEWTVKEVIMNPDSSDLNSSILATHGTKMLRFRGANNAYIFNNDFLDYIYSFDFDAKYYNASHTTAVMKVWYQINGDDWQEIETISLTDSYANFSVIVDKSNVRVRITVDSRSANVDNLVINGIYSGPSNLVTFNNDDVLADVLVKDGSKVSEPTEPAKDGHAFGGWYIDSFFDVLYDFDLPVNEPITLYAKWNINHYDIHYVLNGGTNPLEAPTSFTIESETFLLPTPTRDGYSFDGWFANESFVGNAVLQIEQGTFSDVTVYASWTPITYDIIYNLDGGTNPLEVPETFTIESETFLLPTPTKDDFVFDGWFLNPGFTGDAVLQIEQGTFGDVTLYASFTEASGITFTVTFYAIEGDSVAYEIYLEVDENSTIARPATDPTRSGFQFDDWYLDGSETPFDFLTYQVVEDIIINGRWDEEFTVSFDSNGGSAVAAQTILDGQTAIEPTNPVKSGFEFKGWFTDDVTFLNEFNFSNVITEDVSLFAKWDGKLMIYEVYGGGGNSGATYTHDYIVLYNGTSNTINLTGYSIQYTSATGTSWTNRLNLNGSIESGNYYLIQLASGGSNGIALPTPNITGTINMSATNGKVALVNSTTALTGSNPSNDPSVVDFVGFGTADGFEGSGPAVAPSNSRSIRRKALLDTNDNSADFEFINSPDLSYLSSE